MSVSNVCILDHQMFEVSSINTSQKVIMAKSHLIGERCGMEIHRKATKP